MRFATYVRHLVDAGVARDPIDGMEPGAESIFYYIFGLDLHADGDAREAFNDIRESADFAPYVLSEMNGSMFSDSFGDLNERVGASLMQAAFANYVADAMLRVIGDRHTRGVGG
jgi:hypothetical protein